MHRSFCLVLGGMFSTLVASQVGAQSTIYVDRNATGVQNGASWCTAYRTLSAALAAAAPGDTFLMADGVYAPDPTGLTDPRDATFFLPADAQVGGGLAGCGAPDPDDLDPMAHPTILSGDLNGDDGPDSTAIGDNCRHVVRASGGVAGQRISLVNLTITGGNADGFCCGTTANGGGLLLSNVPAVQISGCLFRRNAANRGGAISSSGGDITIADSVFEENEATYEFGTGGALYATTGTVELRNCLFARNEADQFGGAIVNAPGGAMSILNSTLVANVTGEDGGGLYSSKPLTIKDSILWDNLVIKGGSAGESAQVVNTSMPEALVMDYTCIQGLTGLLGGVGNIGDDPAFRPGPLDNYYLANGVSDPGAVSPCVDAGSDTAANLSLDHVTTSASEEHDAGVVDLGYHRPVTGSMTSLGDADRDGDVDLRDVAGLQRCFSGADVIVNPACRFFDYSGDLDVDLGDYPPFRLDLTGP